ncbi:ArsR/SmtB family transcription factor [Actinoplanes sp. G11-F43]|uniref:ArsR/SmtB family transcription factor n=1 Tax=Actinoplanes sp. G11-F43 TaxID=3424130 RepID=UPI003D326493
MTAADDLATLAGLLADRTRAAMCLALLDGRAWTAGELAVHTGVARSTATEHLNRLINSGLLVEERQGRHRYVRLTGPAVAQLLEDLAGGLPTPPEPGHTGPAGAPDARREPVRGLRAATADEALRRARTCYDHLAGRLGVQITDAMIGNGLLDHSSGFAVTAAGRAWFATELGVDSLTAGRRPPARSCLDWTERRPHLAGVAGARLCAALFTRGWLTRIGSGRAVRLTGSGESALKTILPFR